MPAFLDSVDVDRATVALRERGAALRSSQLDCQREDGQAMLALAERLDVRREALRGPDIAHAIWVLQEDVRSRFVVRTTLANLRAGWPNDRDFCRSVRADEYRQIRSSIKAIRVLEMARSTP